MDDRKHMGKSRDGAMIPIAPGLSEMSEGYLRFIDGIKTEIQNQRITVVMNANASMICLYWKIGRAILDMQEAEGWGAKVIDRMAADLKEAFPEMSGFSPRNIKYMRKFAECWPDFEIVQQVVAQIPWRTNRMLLDKLPDAGAARFWICRSRVGLWNAAERASTTSPPRFRLLIPIWLFRFSRTPICSTFSVLICHGARLRSKGS